MALSRDELIAKFLDEYFPAKCWVQLHTGNPGESGCCNVSRGDNARHSIKFAKTGSDMKRRMVKSPRKWHNLFGCEEILCSTLWDSPYKGELLANVSTNPPVRWERGSYYDLRDLDLGTFR